MPKFKVGDIITGIEDDWSYSVTTEYALMLVTEERMDNIGVIILYHAESRSSIDEYYSVSGNPFRHTTIEEFLERFPDCYKMSDDRLQELLTMYPKRNVEELPAPEPYVLSDEMRKELIEEMKELLTKYTYHPTDEALNKILDEWCKNKGDLIRLFEKHPNYNGKFQIAFDYDFSRVLDREGIRVFRNWLFSNEIQKHFYQEVKVGVYTYRELRDICDRLSYFIELFDSYFSINVYNVNGKTKKEYQKELRHFASLKDKCYINNKDIYIYDGIAYDKAKFLGKSYIDYINRLLDSSSCLEQFVNETAAGYLNRNIPDCKVKKGQKLSRAINKILCSIGLDKLENYNKEFAKFSDSVNPLKIKRHTVISVHPIDYLTMSFGNSWSSCHTIDKKNQRGIDRDHSWGGQSSSGVMSYMLDGTSSIFYTVDSEYNGDKLELENKINRCMFHYYDNRLVQGRVYPQSNDSGANDLYKDIREIAQKVFADMLEVPNYWTNKRGVHECCKAIWSEGTHYRDYENFDNCNISTLKDDKDFHHDMIVGHNPICPCCGKEHYRHKNIECEDCY